MRLYKLQCRDNPNDNAIVWAASAKEAREIAAEHDYFLPSLWENTKASSCRPITLGRNKAKFIVNGFC